MADAAAQLLEQLMRFKPEGVSANAWAVKAGVSRAIWSDLRRHGNPSRRTLEKLLAAAGSSLAEFEALQVGDASPVAGSSDKVADARAKLWRGAPMPPVPLLETRLAGEWGPGSGIALIEVLPSSVVGDVPRPPSLAGDPDAYALTMVSDAMWPRFRLARRLLVSPAAPISAGDDVLVRLAGGGVLVRDLVRQSVSDIELRQFNPDATFAVDAHEIAAIHKVVGEAI